jgi:nitrogen fixation NifU-like protein
MSDLRDLYQEVILDHNRAPRNYRRVEDADRTAKGHNPLCGDQLTLYIKVEGDVLKDVSFLGSGCAISKASASLMTESVRGKTTAEAGSLFQKFHELLTGPPDVKADARSMGKLAVFAGVREFPVRVKCATLAWHTLQQALKSANGTPVDATATSEAE